MNLPHASLPAPQLEVFVLQHHGQDVDYSWPWPAGASESGFDAILSGLDGAGAPAPNRSLRCSLRRVGASEQPVWLLVNSNPELVCTVNNQLLSFGSQMRLDHGDEIELGLTRLVVSLEPSQGLVYPPEEVAPAGQHGALELPGFDLKDLAAAAEGPDGSGAERYGSGRSDFSDLISLQPEESVSGPEAAPVPSQTMAAPVRPAVEDPLQTLHHQYLARLRDPVHSDEQDRWQELVRGGQARQPDPMQQWMQAAGSNHSLDDLLGQTQSIASVIDSLDALGTTDVLAPEPFDSVMHLFAPGYIPAPAEESLESLVQHSLPGLTRREHHSMSLDSAMPFTGAAEQSTEPPRP
jgi:hypothetical protein